MENLGTMQKIADLRKHQSKRLNSIENEDIIATVSEINAINGKVPGMIHVPQFMFPMINLYSKIIVN